MMTIALFLLLASLSEAFLLPNPFSTESKCAGECMFSPGCSFFHGGVLSERGHCSWIFHSCCLRNHADLAREVEEERAKTNRKIIYVNGAEGRQYVVDGADENQLDELKQPVSTVPLMLGGAFCIDGFATRSN